MVRHKIVEWTKAQNANSKALILDTQQKLEEALTGNVPDSGLIGDLSQKLEGYYKEEELFRQQRSRIQWLTCGDRNTAFFHASTRGRRVMNKFSVVEDSDRKAYFEEDQIASAIAKYYSEIFSSSASVDTNSVASLNIVEEVISPLVSPEMNLRLIGIPDTLEIKNAVVSINPDKAPGHDGFSASFYQSFWDIIGSDVTMDIQHFLNLVSYIRDKMKRM